MLSADENGNKPSGKSGQRKAKPETGKKVEAGKKGEPRKRKEAKSSIPKPDQLLDALQRLAQSDEVIAPILEQASAPIPEQASAPIPEQASTPIPEHASAPVTSTENSQSEAPLPETAPTAAAEAADVRPVSLQTIADAYGDYSKKSIEQTSSFVAKLATTRSLDKAFELQTAFAREAYETFVAESRRIRELHREMAKQRLTRLEGFVMGTKRAP